jgi:hypothetical protein
MQGLGVTACLSLLEPLVYYVALRDKVFTSGSVRSGSGSCLQAPEHHIQSNAKPVHTLQVLCTYAVGSKTGLNKGKNHSMGGPGTLPDPFRWITATHK